jgi:hypothetical protein
MSIRLSEITGDIVIGSGSRFTVGSGGKPTVNGRANWAGSIPSTGQAHIVERGSNANGEYVRFADGYQVCSRVLTTSDSADVTWTFPAAFSDSLYSVSGLAILTTLGLRVVVVSTPTATTIPVRCLNGAAARVSIDVMLTAHGRWY